MATVNWGSNSIQSNYVDSQQQMLDFFEKDIEETKNSKNDNVLNVNDSSQNISFFKPLQNFFTESSSILPQQENNTTTTSSSSQINIPKTQAQKLAFYQDSVQNTYIAPNRNKHIFGVMPQDGDLSFYYSPNYSYGNDNITEYQQVVIVDDGSDKECHCLLVWEDITVTT